MSTVDTVARPTGIPPPAPEPAPPPPPTRPEAQLILPGPDDAAAFALARRGILSCRRGQPVARRVETPADSPPSPQRVPVGELRLGQFVAWDAALEAYVAGRAGHAVLQHGKLEVADTLELSDDVDGAAGPVTFDGHLIVHHNVLDLAVLQATGNITVHGSIEAAAVHAGGDLQVHHGICGKEKGRVAARGRVTARFITNARTESGGDMVISNEVVNSHLACGGILKVEHGTILAGHAIALGGIVCHTAGSEVGAKTILESGLAPDHYAALQKTMATAELTRQKVREIRSAVEPLLARAKTLTAAQKEKATELLYTADEAEARAQAAVAALAQSRAAVQSCLGVRMSVTGLLHPGVIVRYPIAEAVVTAPLRGPLEIALISQGGETQVVVMDRGRNSCLPLQSLPGADGRIELAHKLLAGAASAPAH